MSFARDKLEFVLSNFLKASSFLFLYFNTPAASSNIMRLSSGVDENTFSTSPCEIILNDALDIPESIRRVVISFSLHLSLFKKYSFSPVLYTLLFIEIVEYGVFINLSVLSNTNSTDAAFSGFLDLEPENITSVIEEAPRNSFTDC